MVRIVAVIPTLGKDVLRLNSAIESIQRFPTPHDLKIVVVNNSLLSTIPDLASGVESVFPGMNLGYVGALEHVRRKFPSDFLWSVQDDMTLTNDVLSSLLEKLELDSQLAVVSPVLVRDGIIPARTRAGIFTNVEKTQWQNIPLEDVSPILFEVPEELSFVSGSGAVFRSAALSQIGGFNVALFPLMHVDVDVCARLLKAGWSIALDTSAHISHVINGSTPHLLARVLDRLNRPVVEEYLASGVVSQPHQPEVDPDILAMIGQKSSQLILDISQAGNQKIYRLERRIARLQSSLHDLEVEHNLVIRSKSWKMTQPLRKISRVVRKVVSRETS